MKIVLARIITILFHPLIMPTAGLLLLFNSGTYLEYLSYQQQRAIFIIYFTGTAILPLTLIPIMMVQRMIASPAMERHDERVFPLMVTVLFYGFTWYMLSRLNVPGMVSVYAMMSTMAVLLVAMISLKWKISLHMTAQGALAGALLAVAFRHGVNLHLYISLVFLSGGLAGWARLSLKAHSHEQIYAGYFAGLVLAFFILHNF
jgi:hypothetical protein